MIFRVMVLAAIFAFGSAHADCVDPYKPAIERTELSTNHNSYAEESEICITEKAEYCDHCVAGYKHKCEGGWWQPQTHLSCSAEENERGSTGGLRSSGQSDQDRGDRATQNSSDAADPMDSCVAILQSAPYVSKKSECSRIDDSMASAFDREIEREESTGEFSMRVTCPYAEQLMRCDSELLDMVQSCPNVVVGWHTRSVDTVSEHLAKYCRG